MNGIVSKNPDYQFFIYLLVGDKEEVRRLADLTDDCESEKELIDRLKQIGVLSVGLMPEELESDALTAMKSDMPPERRMLIDRLIREYFTGRRLTWEPI